MRERLFPSSKQDPSMWLEESIWGHRFYDEQTPWFVYLEFLNVYAHERGHNRALQEPNGFNSLKYAPAKRRYLRNILFNYPFSRMEWIHKRNSNDDTAWNILLKELREQAVGIPHADFSYLRNRFDTYKDLVEVIRLMHGSCLELSSNKRWTSKFVFPYCEEALYEDLDKKAATNDRRFFGRTGELLYLMLCRSGYAEELRKLIDEKLLCTSDVWQALIKALQPDEEHVSEPKAGGFLPYKEHPRFTELAKDWLTILKQPMPANDRVHHLVILSGLHLFLYQQDLAREELGDTTSCIVAEILAPKKTLVRELSVESYQENNVLSARAIDVFMDKIEKGQDWIDSAKGPSPYESCQSILKSRVRWPNDGDYEGHHDPELLMCAFKEAARKRHKQHVGNIHRVYGREIGLISKRGTNRLRYAPNDTFLKSLIMANVEVRSELREFLRTIYDRYGIVMGTEAAQDMLKHRQVDVDQKAFQDNSIRLEQRLGSIGLLKRLSDACAYVLNPYAGGNNDRK